MLGPTVDHVVDARPEPAIAGIQEQADIAGPLLTGHHQITIAVAIDVPQHDVRRSGSCACRSVGRRHEATNLSRELTTSTMRTMKGPSVAIAPVAYR
jgi:hypothetical protein